MAKREVKRSFTFEQQRQEINLLADDLGDRAQLDALSTDGQNSLVGAINEIIDTPVDDVFVDEIGVSTQEQRMIFADAASFKPSASYDGAAGTNPESLDYSRIKYDYGAGTVSDRFTYNPNNKLLRVNNLKADLRNRNQDGTLSSLGQEVLSVGTNADSVTESETALYTGRLRTKITNAPIEIQQDLIKLEEKARMSLANSSAIDLTTGIDIGAYVNVTNNKKILYVSVDDENASDLPENDGSNINRPFKTIERALIEAAKRSYVGPGKGIEQGEPGADLFENFTILLFPGEYIIDNTPGVKEDGITPYTAADISEEIKSRPGEPYHTTTSFANELKKFNPKEGGLIVPRGTSIVGLDLRKTLIRPKYVPDPANDEVGRSALFRLTGACYIWQFTIKDNQTVPESHHKLTGFEYANYEQLEDYYRKIDKYSRTDEGADVGDRFLDAQNLLLDNKKFIAQLAVARTEIASSGFNGIVTNTTAAGDTVGQACADDVELLIEQVAYNLAYGGNDRVYDAAKFYKDNIGTTIQGEEEFSILVFNQARDISNQVVCNVTVDTSAFSNGTLNYTEPGGFKTQVFDYNILPDATVNPEDNTDPNNCANVRSSITTLWEILTETLQSIIDVGATNATIGTPAVTRATPTDAQDYIQRVEENRIVGFVQNKYLSDTVASASPYVFNISLRSVWGMCGLMSDGAQSTGLRSMVLAQYTGISLQRDDRAFILNGATTDQVEDPDQRHSDSLAEYRDDWRHYHVKSRNNSFLQIVSVFAVGQADHFVVETGGDHSITNSNSNFGNSSLSAVSHRTEIFNQDNGAYIVGIVPPRGLNPNAESKVNIYNIDFGTTLKKFNAAEVDAGDTKGFRKIYVKVNGQSLIKEADIPEYYSFIPETTTEQAELLVDDVNYLLGKRRYSDTYPEAIYARLPRNYADSTLATFASRLRANGYVSGGNSAKYDPRPTYSEGVITADSKSTSSDPVPAAAQIETSIKNYYILNDNNTSVETPDFFTSADPLASNAKHIGVPTTGGNSTARFKLLTGNNPATQFTIAVLESPIKTVAIQGNAAPTTGTPVVYKGVIGTPTPGTNEVAYTYNRKAFNLGGETVSQGLNATFEITRVNGTVGQQTSGNYVIKVLTSGINYNVGDSFSIPGTSLGGISPDNDLTIHVVAVTNSGEGFKRGNDFRVTFTDSTVPATSKIVRLYIKDATLPQGIFVDTNDLYEFDSLTNANYDIPSGGFDAQYYVGLSSTNSVDPWDFLGKWGVPEQGTYDTVVNTEFSFIRTKGGSGFSAANGFNTITIPGSIFYGTDNVNDLVIKIDAVGGNTVTTKNYNDNGTTPKRRYYGWEFARTVGSEYYGRLVLLVDDERTGGTQIIEGVPSSFAYNNAGTRFTGFGSNQQGYPATATTIGGLNQDRTITTIVNNLNNTFTLTLDNPPGVTRSPFYKGDEIILLNTANIGNTASLDGTYKVVTVTQDAGNDLVTFNVADIDLNAITSWQGTGTARKISEEVTIEVKLSILSVGGNEGEVTAIYPRDWNFTIDGDEDLIPGELSDQNFAVGWDKSGSGFSFDDIFLLNTGAGTSLLPENTITFSAATLEVLPAKTYSPSSIKESGYLPGSSLGVRYLPYDETLSLENNTVTYGAADSTVNESLSLLKRITQRVDSNASAALESSDGFEFNDNIVNTLYMKRIQDTRSSNGNSELLWRLICKLPKDGFNNLKLRAPEEKFVIHLKDPGLGFADETLDFPFVYDHAEIGKLRNVKVISGTTQASRNNATVTISNITSRQYIKPARRGGDGVTYLTYPTYSSTIGAETLAPSGGSFSVKYGPTGIPISATVVSEGKCYNNGDRIILNDGLSGTITLEVTKATTTYPRSFYVQKVEPIVEYEYNVRDGYYLLTVLDGNIHTYYNQQTNTNSEDDKRIVYGKQRLIGFEDLDIPPDGILSEINHRKQDASDLIEKNRLFIQTEANGYLKNAFPGFTNPSENRCKRDVGYLLNALINDLRLGGNNNVINTAQYYFSSGTLKFIESGQLTQTRATFEYAKHLAICAMRNWDTFRTASSTTTNTITLANTDGIVVGMRVYEVATAIPTDAASQTTANANLTSKGYIASVNRTTNVVTVYAGRTGTTSPNLTGNLKYKFVLEQGLGENWASPGTAVPVIDTTVAQDYNYAAGECANVASAINVLYTTFDQIISASSATANVSNGSTVLFNSSTLADNDVIRVFGAQNDALNGDLITVNAEGGTLFSYELNVQFQTSFSDNIVYYKNTNSIEFNEPTKATYFTEEVILEGLGYSQNINYLYPEIDLDNPKWNPKPSLTQYRKDVGNTIIRNNTLNEDDYERISQYSITAESTKGILNSILTGGVGATGFRNRIFADIDLNAEFGAGETITDEVMENPYVDPDLNEYGVNTAPVLQFDQNNVPLFTDRCIIFNAATPISFYRPSIIRASSHTWEYVGFGPGNYSTGLPQFQDITLTQQQIVNSQTIERGGGFCASSGTNSEGDFYIGNQVIDAKGNQSNTLNFPRVKTSAENRLIDYSNLDSLAANTSSASFNPSSFSAVLTASLQAIQEAQRNSFKSSNIETSILTTGTLKINNKISISNNVFENEANFPVARQDTYGFSRRASINWFNVDPTSEEYQGLSNSYISPVDISDWANANSLVPSVPVPWTTVYSDPTVFNEVSNVGEVDINATLTKSVNFTVTGIDTTDERWYDAVTDTISIPLGTPADDINNTNINNYEGRAGQIYINFPADTVKASSIIPTNIWKPVENTWTGVSQVDGSATTYLQGSKFVVSYYITGGQIIYSVSTVES
jgi:hypothetical protein